MKWGRLLRCVKARIEGARAFLSAKSQRVLEKSLFFLL